MPEKDTIYSSKIKSVGIFSFTDFYKFCYDWLIDETGLTVKESKYVEKLSGDSKNIDIKWEGNKKLTDYFRFDMTIEFKIIGLTKVEINRGGEKIKTNEGSVEVKVKSELVRDYEGKFETGGYRKFLRGIY